ncbi:MAG: division/cell wall cluster transcriptional repressor MraZ [Eubacteriales bacterium]|nr:division/cell wall cluster transcriptional repressor MraZ [Eubacteriales bacterium]
MIGKYSAKLDDKGRLFVPAKLRQELGETFFVTLGVNCGHRCLTIYTAPEWQRLSDNFNALSISQRAGATSLIFMNAAECAPDKQFRFTLTQFLTQYAGIRRDVMIVGRAGQAEIWDAEEFAAFEAENLSPEKLLASLEAIGL